MSQDLSSANQESTSGGAGKAVGIGVWVLIALIVICILAACVIIAVLMLLGPAVGNVFSNIVENLEVTPVP